MLGITGSYLLLCTCILPSMPQYLQRKLDEFITLFLPLFRSTREHKAFLGCQKVKLEDEHVRLVVYN